jgi:hypothetical protein
MRSTSIRLRVRRHDTEPVPKRLRVENVFSLRFDYLQQKRDDNTLWYYQVFSLRFDYLQQKRDDNTLWYYQVFSSIFELPSTKRNEDMYDVFRYSHRYSNYLRQRETRTCMMSSGILIDNRITIDLDSLS